MYRAAKHIHTAVVVWTSHLFATEMRDTSDEVRIKQMMVNKSLQMFSLAN